MKKQDKIQSLIDNLDKLNFKQPIKVRAMSSVRKDKDGKPRQTDKPVSYHLYLDQYKDGKRQYQFLKLYLIGDPRKDDDSLRLAVEIRDKRQLEMRENQAGFTLSDWRKKSDFITYLEEMAQTKHQSWNATLSAIKKFNPGKLPFGAIDHNYIERFKEHLLSKFHPNTAGLYLTIIKSALNRAVRNGIIEKNPAQYVSIKKQETRKDYLTVEDVEKLMETDLGNAEIKRAFLFACFTGLRLSDIESLRWTDIREGKLTIRQRKTADLITQKLIPQALDILGEPKSSGLVFDLPCRITINVYLAEWTNRASIDKHIRFHNARHTFAILQLAEGGADIYTVSKLLGHRNLQTTQVYAKVVDSLKDKAMDNYGGIFSRKVEK